MPNCPFLPFRACGFVANAFDGPAGLKTATTIAHHRGLKGENGFKIYVCVVAGNLCAPRSAKKSATRT